jgi:hypothetical protein
MGERKRTNNNLQDTTHKKLKDWATWISQKNGDYDYDHDDLLYHFSVLKQQWRYILFKAVGVIHGGLLKV